MKNVQGVVLIMALIVPICMFAQDYAVDKGVITAGGMAGYISMGGDLHENSDGDGISVITIHPMVGYFIMPNLGVGLNFEYKSWSQGDDKENTLGIGPGVAYFLGDANSDMYPFIAVGYSYKSVKNGYEYTRGDIPIQIGVVKMLAKNVGLVAGVAYTIESKKPKDQDAIKGNMLEIALGINTFIF